MFRTDNDVWLLVAVNARISRRILLMGYMGATLWAHWIFFSSRLYLSTEIYFKIIGCWAACTTVNFLIIKPISIILCSSLYYTSWKCVFHISIQLIICKEKNSALNKIAWHYKIRYEDYNVLIARYFIK